MPYTVSIATKDTRDLIVEALNQAADQRTRVARKAAGTLAEDRRAGKDVRSSAVKIANLLAEANDLALISFALASALDVPLIQPTPHAVPAPPVPPPYVEQTPTPAAADDGTGTSPEAQAAAALAGLEPSDPDDVEDEHGATAEDRAGTPERIDL